MTKQKSAELLIVFPGGVARTAVIPQIPSTWKNGNIFHQVVFNSALTVDSPEHCAKMPARNDQFVFRRLGERMLETDDLRWHDATCYNWRGLLDGYEIAGDERFLNKVREPISCAIREHENDLRNCDRVAPTVPLLRLYEITQDATLLDYAVENFDRSNRL